MKSHQLQVSQRRERFVADDRRVITRLFVPGSSERVKGVIHRVLQLDEQEVHRILDELREDFVPRHRHIEDVWHEHFEEVVHEEAVRAGPSSERRLLIGAFFTMEYAIESAALFNPSIVPHHDQQGLPEGSLRFLMSLRATGEGHISSLVFRTGIIDGEGHLQFDPASKFARSLKPSRQMRYDRQTFLYKLIEMGAYNDRAGDVLDLLPEQFVQADLDRAVEEARRGHSEPELFTETAENLLGLARSNYELQLPSDSDPSEAVIFPISENESRGIEDMRLVQFTDDDGSVCYYGTYTAFNGFRIFPQLLETRSFETISIATLNGRYAQNKGHALFPRRVGGWYVMCSRIDGENLFILRSKNVRFWNDAEMMRLPRSSWEFVQVGNCGSPMETPEGWLLLTHGVGPMRQYCIGACLLDLEDPTRVIGHLKEPLLVPADDERDGYVPNVVYTCGALIHRGQVMIPYAIADAATRFASVPLEQLLDVLKGGLRA